MRLTTDGRSTSDYDLPIKLRKMSEHRTEATLHRALAEQHRARVLDELNREPDGLDAHELGRRLELHPNTIRWHLAILAEAGLVSSHPEVRTTPGRPRTLYALAEDSAARHENYRLLASILTATLAELPDGSARASEAGRAWGRYLVRRPPPHVRLSDTEAVAQIVEFLAQEGFRPSASADEIRMRSCPFRELAESGQQIVCAAHSGLISGALAELGSELRVERLDAFVEPHLCIAHLRR
jgi:predicted ArsR family transcriptional regulator